MLLRSLLLVSFSSLAFSQSVTTSLTPSSTLVNSTSTTSVPFFSIPNTFTPTATGSSPIPGSVITLANGPYLSDSFTYTAAASTVPPTGNITNSQVPASAGGAGGNTALEPDPTNLQTVNAAIGRKVSWGEGGGGMGLLVGGSVVLMGILGGGLVL